MSPHLSTYLVADVVGGLDTDEQRALDAWRGLRDWGTLKRMGTCSAYELRTAAMWLEEQAFALVDEARKLEEWAETLEAHPEWPCLLESPLAKVADRLSYDRGELN